MSLDDNDGVKKGWSRDPEDAQSELREDRERVNELMCEDGERCFHVRALILRVRSKYRNGLGGKEL